MESYQNKMTWGEPPLPKGPKHFGERLKTVIGKQSVASFARDCGVSEASMRKYLKTDTVPGIDSVAMIAACTGRSLTWLITGEGDPFTDNAKQKRFSEEETKKWWTLIFDALDTEDKSSVIMAFSARRPECGVQP